MKTRLYTWAMTFPWPPRWPFARFWATEGDVASELRKNAKSLEDCDSTLRMHRDQIARLQRGK